MGFDLGLEGFGETLAKDFPEFAGRQPLYITRGYIKKSHAAKRTTCFKCHGSHTRSEHKSHGTGSFCRTHNHSSCRR